MQHDKCLRGRQNFGASFNMNTKRELWNVKELNLGSEVRWHIWWWEIGVILCRFATWDHAIIQINLGPIIVLCQFHESNFCLLLLHFVADCRMCILYLLWQLQELPNLLVDTTTSALLMLDVKCPLSRIVVNSPNFKEPWLIVITHVCDMARLLRVKSGLI